MQSKGKKGRPAGAGKVKPVGRPRAGLSLREGPPSSKPALSDESVSDEPYSESESGTFEDLGHDLNLIGIVGVFGMDCRCCLLTGGEHGGSGLRFERIFRVWSSNALGKYRCFVMNRHRNVTLMNYSSDVYLHRS